MTRITEDAKLEFHTVEAAEDYIGKLRGRVRFQVRIAAFLPIDAEPGTGFEGSTFVTISKVDFMRAIRDMGNVLVDKRGGKFVLRVNAGNDKRSLSFVSLY